MIQLSKAYRFGGTYLLVNLLIVSLLFGLSACGVTTLKTQTGVWSLAYNSQGTQLIAGYGGLGSDYTVRIWNPPNPQAAPIVLTAQSEIVEQLALSSDNHRLAVGCRTRTICLWDFTNLTVAPAELSLTNDLNTLAWKPNSPMLAVGVAVSVHDYRVQLWRVGDSTTELTELAGHKADISALVFSPDNRYLVATGADGIVWLWNMEHPNTMPTVLKGVGSPIWGAAFHPNQSLLAAGCGDKVCVWDVQQPNIEPTVLSGHTQQVYAVAFSLDGQTLASGSTDTTIRLWRYQQPNTSATVLRGHNGGVRTLVFSPDGQSLTSGSLDGTIRLWNWQQQPITSTELIALPQP